MTPEHKSEKLLEDILENESYCTFKDALYGRCQAQLHQQRSFFWKPLLCSAAILGISFLFLWYFLFYFPSINSIPEVITKSEDPVADPLKKSITISTAFLILTQPLSEERVVKTQQPTIEIVSSHSIQFVQTLSSVSTISDQELLSFFPKIPCALLQNPFKKRTLVFFHPENSSLQRFSLP